MTIEALNAMVAHGYATPRQAQLVASAFGLDPSAVVVPCEAPGCSNSVAIGKSVSYVVVQATTGDSGLGSYQCESEQHYGCSPECGIAAAHRCMREDLAPRLSAVAVPGSEGQEE